MADVLVPRSHSQERRVQYSPKKKRASGPKKAATHPPFAAMIRQAIATLKERKGSSRQAIQKYICGNFAVAETAQTAAHLRTALKKGVTGGTLKQATGVGAAGRFRNGPTPKVAKPKKAKKVKKAKKPLKPKKKKVAKKPKAKKMKKVAKKSKKATKKPKAKKVVKKATTAKPKKAAKPKKPAAKKAKSARPAKK